MNCCDFEDRLDLFAAGMLPRDEQDCVKKHLNVCSRCRTLAAIVMGEVDIPAELPEDFTSSILRRTSGPACAGVEQELCAWVDGTLERDDRELVALHLAHCAGCDALTASLADLKGILPGMATLEPDSGFTADVLQVTVGSRSGVRVAPHPFDARDWWRRMIRRPRFAWEAAYVGALLVLMIFQNPAILPRALAAPEILARGRDRLLEETATVLEDQQAAARQSLSDLRLKSRTFLDQAADFQSRTTSAVRRQAESVFQDFWSIISGGDRANAPKRDLR